MVYASPVGVVTRCPGCPVSQGVVVVLVVVVVVGRLEGAGAPERVGAAEQLAVAVRATSSPMTTKSRPIEPFCSVQRPRAASGPNRLSHMC